MWKSHRESFLCNALTRNASIRLVVGIAVNRNFVQHGYMVKVCGVNIGGIVRDFSGVAGPIPIERLIRMHLGDICALRRGGLTWSQVSGLLLTAGVRRTDGRGFAPAHLRGVFHRQLARHEVDKRKERHRLVGEKLSRPIKAIRPITEGPSAPAATIDSEVTPRVDRISILATLQQSASARK